MNGEIKRPSAEQILAIGESYKGKGRDGDEWSVGYMIGDDGVRWYSGVGSEVYAMCKRLAGNPDACISIRDAGDGVFMLLDRSECRRPSVIVKSTPANTRKARVARVLGGAE